MRFSDCGNFFFGMKIGHPDKGTPVFLHVAPMLYQEPLSICDVQTTTGVSLQPTTFRRDSLVFGSKDKAFILGAAVATQNSGMPAFSFAQGQLQISALTQDGDKGSVILRTMRADGTEIKETITRIPKSSTLEMSYSSLVPTGDHSQLRLVLNKAIQDTYSIVESSDFKLPAVLERKKDSIPVQIYAQQQRVEMTTETGKRCIEESVSDSEETILPKRRK
jgi:hypothetical protein